jgi:uncharacterized NAD(P)/FAD-binding protein YdhS
MTGARSHEAGSRPAPSSWRLAILSPQQAFTPVAIVGAGFSGTILAAQLARHGISSVLVEARADGGSGTAYSTDEPAHLLNVPAEGMSAWPDEPKDFARAWAGPGGDKAGFAPRLVYGRYLRAILDRTVKSGWTRLVRATATAAERSGDGWLLRLDGGTTIRAFHLVLATGNEAPRRPTWAGALDERFVADPWSTDARRAIARVAQSGGDVLVAGTGLTMIDAVLSLESAGHRGRIMAVSRRGLLPRSHAGFTAAPVEAGELPEPRITALTRWLRERAAEVGWIAAVNALRPHSQALWRRLDTTEKRRFLRHARPWWDVHRHRIAPEVAARIEALIEAGRLEVIAGRIVEAGNGSVRIARRGAGGARQWRAFELVLNCTGPLGTISETANPLLRQLIGDGYVTPDALGLGVALGEGSRAKGHPDLWAIGPLARGEHWEITAVPDIRVQAAGIAEAIAAGELAREPAEELRCSTG